jgi:hypothetical protein
MLQRSIDLCAAPFYVGSVLGWNEQGAQADDAFNAAGDDTKRSLP